jgi:para-nitrobenzyl esterase
VTVFGESAGGADVLTLMAAPSARGLFQKAAVESGGGWSAPVTLDGAEAAGRSTAVQLGLPDDATLDQLRALPVEALVRVGGRVDLGPRARIEPVIDGRLLAESTTQAFARGHAARVPLLIGSNSYEASLMTSSDLFNLPNGLAVAYAGYPPNGSPSPRDQAVFTDSVMGAPARWIAGKASNRPRSWLYYFSYVRVVRRGRIPGANHASEIPYVFDTQGLVPNYSAEITDEDRAMARVVHSCWVAFAKRGVPACAAAPPWPAYSRAADQLMEFGLSTGVRTHFRTPQLDVVQATQAAVLGGR